MKPRIHFNILPEADRRQWPSATPFSAGGEPMVLRFTPELEGLISRTIYGPSTKIHDVRILVGGQGLFLRYRETGKDGYEEIGWKTETMGMWMLSMIESLNNEEKAIWVISTIKLSLKTGSRPPFPPPVIPSFLLFEDGDTNVGFSMSRENYDLEIEFGPEGYEHELSLNPIQARQLRDWLNHNIKG